MPDEVTIITPAGHVVVVVVRRANADEVIDLRHAILRAGLPRESAIFAGDDDPASRHVAAISAEGKVVGCATAHLQTWEGSPAWQIRGMATDPTHRGAGVGAAMLEMLERLLAEASTIRQMWCNARVSAAGFYERQGWRVVSEPFPIHDAGPHVKMTKRIA
jgi:GNAT superfamily N-acetyltransferase